ncbi:MAG: cell division FtsA domain-containing protein [Alphaproteobacteria bacterium]
MLFLTIFEKFAQTFRAQVFEVSSKGEAILRTSLSQVCEGLSETGITNPTTVFKTIQGMRNQLDAKLGVPIQNIFLSIRGLPVESKVLFFSKEFEKPQPITKKEIAETLAQKKFSLHFKEKIILHSFPLRYKIDERVDIENPEGMIGKKLGIAFHFLVVDQKEYDLYLSIFKKADLKVEKIVESRYATAFGALPDQMKKEGSLLIDFGKSDIQLTVYEKRTPLFLHAFPFGAGLIQKDIQKVLNVTKEQATYLDKKYGHALVLSEDHLKNATLPIDEDTQRTFSLFEITQMTSARMKEILKLIFLSLEKKGVLPHIKSVGICGEGAERKYLSQLAHNIFHRPIHIFPKKGEISWTVKGMVEQRLNVLKTHKQELAYNKKSSNRTFELLRKFIKENL